MSNIHGVASTSGHLASNGGLRGHSVGDVFPYVPYFKGNPHEGALEQWVITPKGKHLRVPNDTSVAVWVEADIVVEALKESLNYQE